LISDFVQANTTRDGNNSCEALVANKSYDILNYNPATLFSIENIKAGISYKSNYLLKELSTKEFAIALPTKSGVFGLSISDFGYNLYREDIYSLSFAKKLSNKFNTGIKFNYFNLHLGDIYGNKGLLYFDIGIIYELSKNIDIAFSISNPTLTKLAKYNDERLPAIINLGFAWHLNEKIDILAENEKNIYSKYIFKTGIEYNLTKSFCFKIGLTSNNFTYFFGCNFKYKQIIFNTNFIANPKIGYYPNTNLIYSFQ
jgi:hypothetical protein